VQKLIDVELSNSLIKEYVEELRRYQNDLKRNFKKGKWQVL